MDTWGQQAQAAMGVSGPSFDVGDTAAAVRDLRAILEASGDARAGALGALEFTNSLDDVRAWLSRSAAEVHARPDKVESYYVEMNGFSINPEEWYAELMGMQRVTRENIYAYYDPSPEVHAREHLTLLGAEPIQQIYADAMEGAAPEVHAAADYLVHATFVDLVRRAWEVGPIDSVSGSLVVTAHDMQPALFLEAHQ